MPYQDFVALVKEMRQAQVEYFRDRNSVNLFKAKGLERAVDKAIFDYKNGPDLFPKDEP